MGAPSKRARKIRSASEFDIARIQGQLATPRTGRIPLTSWSLDQIFLARDSQLRGHFQLPARLAESMRTDDALSVAFNGRLAPQRSIKTELVPAKGARGLSVAAEADALFGNSGVGITPDARASIHACLANHDVAFATCQANPRADGSRIDLEVHAWPIEYVRWDPFYRVFKTRVDPATIQPGDAPDPTDPEYGAVGGFEVPIIHGDGRWIIFQRFEIDPFKHAACLAAAIVWARHAYAARDWAKGSVAHGSAKVTGALPTGVALQTADGALTSEAAAMVAALKGIATSDSPVVLKPAGADIQFLTNNSTAWQVWAELILNAERAAARIYLGTDGILGTTGGSPGVDIESLFGVAATMVQGDLACISRGLQTGALEPWAAMNFGTSEFTPTHRYVIPDSEADALHESENKRRVAFQGDIKTARDNGFVVDQAYVDRTASVYGIDAPQLPAATEAKVPTIALAPTDLAGVVSVNEARASAGLGPLMTRAGVEDPDGYITVGEYTAKKAATATAPMPSPAPAALRSVQ